MDDACVVGRFTDLQRLEQAIPALQALGYRHMDAWLPYPAPAVEQALGIAPSPVPKWTLAGGATGLVAAMTMQLWTNAVSYPVYVGGFAPVDFIAYIPIAFESSVLGAVLAAVVAFLYHTRLPAWWHPVFAAASSVSASRDGFLLLVPCDGAPFGASTTEEHLRAHNADDVQTVQS